MTSVIRKFTWLIYLVLISGHLYAQNVGINSSGAAPDASAMLDIVATDKGLLIPRVALTATNVASPVTSPTTSLLVYNTATAGTSPNNVVPGYYYWNGTAWVALLTANNTSWTLTGNSGTIAGTNFIGTTDGVDLVTKTNNTERTRVSSSGNFRVGTTAFNVTNPEKLLIDAGTTASVNGIVGKGSIDSYLQLNIQNQSAGTSASSDVVATANNGSETTNYVDMGINGQNYSGGIMGAANDAYLYNIGQNLLIGTGTAAKSLVFMTGGTSQSSNERMRINGSGNVGIGTSTFSGGNPERLIVNAGSTGGNAFQNVIIGKGNTNSYAQFNIQNQSGGTASSSDVVATANNGTETADYIDMGINGGSNTSTGMLGGANTAYLYSTGNDFVIGNASVNQDLIFFTDGTASTDEKMRITAAGNVGIGTNDLSGGEKLLVDAEGTTNTAISAAGSINGYLEVNVQNSNNGNNASSDVVATANNGTDNSVYVDMGINSQGYSNGGGPNSLLNGSNTAYLYAHGNDFKIGNGTPNKPLVFFTNPSTGTLGTNTAHGVERIRIAQDGKVGIGDYSAADPNSTLSVTGSVGYAITTTNSNLTLDDTHHTIIITSGTPTINLPTAASSTRRVYVIVNQTGSSITTSSYLNFTGAGTTTVAANGSITVQSNGTNWYRIQ